MDTSLITVTLLSMTMAVALSLVVWRMLREERRRSEARVMALTELAQRPERRPAVERERLLPAPPPSAPIIRRTQPVVDAPLDLPLHEPAARIRTNVQAPAFLAEPVSPSPWGHRLVIMLALGLAAAAVVLFALAIRGSTTAPRPSLLAGTASAANAANGGLELLSLRDARQAGTLTVTGLVQNPRNGVMLKNVTVTADAFDDRGAFLATGHALIDVTSLSPGDESSFVVTLPVSDLVARYRVGFRGEDGRVISHVDRRQVGTVAQNW